jgi:hypothetical protein
MKKKILFAILLISIAFANSTNAQVSLSLNFNIGSQPAWGPTGYDRVEYYYMPDIDAYYYVPKKQFIYLNNNHWVFANSLPYKYSGYNLYRGHKVVINRPSPYKDGDMYRNKYAGFSGGRGPQQESIRDSKDDKYKDHPGNKGHKEKEHGNKHKKDD